MFGFLKSKKKKDGPTDAEREASERHEAAHRKYKRKAAERRVIDAMEASRAARQSIELAEQAAEVTVSMSREETDRGVRKVQKYHSEISGEFTPKPSDNGGGRTEAAAEPAEAEPEHA